LVLQEFWKATFIENRAPEYRIRITLLKEDLIRASHLNNAVEM
jgi:hypothetical protein